jgi:hypothetical protein
VQDGEHSAKNFSNFFSLPSAVQRDTRQRFFFKKNSLSSARVVNARQRFFQIFFLCRMPCRGTLGKEIFKKKKSLPSARVVSTQQKNFQKKIFSLPSAIQRDTRQSLKKIKKFFAECPAKGHSAKHPFTCRVSSRQLFFCRVFAECPTKSTR